MSGTLQVYRQRTRPSPAISSLPSVDLPPTDLYLPIAIRNGTRVSTAHPISYFISYDRLHSTLRGFALSITFESIPRNYQDAILLP